MDPNESSANSREPSLRELLQQASTEQDREKLLKLLDEINARFARGEQVSETH